MVSMINPTPFSSRVICPSMLPRADNKLLIQKVLYLSGVVVGVVDRIPLLEALEGQCGTDDASYRSAFYPYCSPSYQS